MDDLTTALLSVAKPMSIAQRLVWIALSSHAFTLHLLYVGG